MVRDRRHKRRILLIVDDLTVGGMQKQLLAVLRSLPRERDYSICLAVLHPGGILDAAVESCIDLVVPVRQPARIRNAIYWIPSLAFQAARYRIELIHGYGQLSSIVGVTIGRMLGISVIHGAIRSAPPVLEGSQRVSKLMARYSTVVVANSNAGVRAYGLERSSNVLVIRNGLSEIQFCSIDVRRESKFDICMVANFIRYKDHLTLLRAVEIVSRTRQDLRVVLIGNDYGTRQEVERWISGLGLADIVLLVVGNSDPSEYLRASRIGVLTSNERIHGEGISNVLLEYGAAGIPSIATNGGGSPECIIHETTGLLVPPGDAAILAVAVSRLLEGPAEAAKMGRAAARWVRSQYHIERTSRQYDALYRSLLPHIYA